LIITKQNNMKAKSKLRLINGYSESAWKSLAIKSVRIGWRQGLEESAKNLSKSGLASILVGSLFEDVFPHSFKDLNECYIDILNQDWQSLCERNTLHGRGYAQPFFDYAEEACSTGKLQGDSITREIRQKTQISWINPRVYNCLWTWYVIKPEPKEFVRTILDHEWQGMPKNVLDGHTYEGKRMGLDCTLLSGHYENHLAIGNRVMLEGWEPIRQEFINDEIVGPTIEQTALF
jgi:hypothetical protein